MVGVFLPQKLAQLKRFFVFVLGAEVVPHMQCTLDQIILRHMVMLQFANLEILLGTSNLNKGPSLQRCSTSPAKVADTS